MPYQPMSAVRALRNTAVSMEATQELIEELAESLPAKSRDAEETQARNAILEQIEELEDAWTQYYMTRTILMIGMVLDGIGSSKKCSEDHDAGSPCTL